MHQLIQKLFKKQRIIGEIKKDFCGISELFDSNLEIKHLKYV